ncbi:hypothetical protein [Nonomuraea bangladeshensis]|uniref:hypothetical protein n=1 Tax=Nonomuraea bangladeshensis TaxID=404385 RepID=UPI003C2E1807
MRHDRPRGGGEHHHGSHRHLIDVFEIDAFEAGEEPAHGRGAIDAIIVPTIRHPRWLTYATRLALDLGCHLVSLHSRNWSRAREAAQAMPDGLRYISADVDHVDRLRLPDFETTAVLRDTPFARTTDLSAKRNTGLLLARLLGWRRIVFLDDDIEVGRQADVERVAALLDTYDVVGMHIGGYPDNSVVCHAHRLTGGHQESFVGGGALAVAVDPGRTPSFFPNVYNEDWFYLLGERRLRRLAVAGQVRQRPYDPFDRPVRARDQEFGDVLAEGVYWLLDGDPTAEWGSAADAAYWRDFLARRQRFVEDVLSRVRRLPPGPRHNRHAMENSLLAALGRLRRIEPELCAGYLKAWAVDRERWAAHLDELPHLEFAAADAIKWLVKDGERGLHWYGSMTG